MPLIWFGFFFLKEEKRKKKTAWWRQYDSMAMMRIYWNKNFKDGAVIIKWFSQDIFAHDILGQ